MVSDPARSAGKAHEHGALKIDEAIEGNKLTILMEAPLDNLLGFERAPCSDAERKPAAKDDHADLDTGCELGCAQPGELRSLDVGLLGRGTRVRGP